jgi:hypothetical protein
MRTLTLAIATAAVLAAGSLGNRADAMTIGSPAGLRHAIEDTDLTDKVHCRWGWRHHRTRWGWWDGCYHGYRNYYYSGPVIRFHHRRVYRSHRHVHRHHRRHYR